MELIVMLLPMNGSPPRLYTITFWYICSLAFKLWTCCVASYFHVLCVPFAVFPFSLLQSLLLHYHYYYVHRSLYSHVEGGFFSLLFDFFRTLISAVYLPLLSVYNRVYSFLLLTQWRIKIFYNSNIRLVTANSSFYNVFFSIIIRRNYSVNNALYSTN